MMQIRQGLKHHSRRDRAWARLGGLLQGEIPHLGKGLVGRAAWGEGLKGKGHSKGAVLQVMREALSLSLGRWCLKL